MTSINIHQILPYLHRYNVSHAMIKILEEQHINDEDLQTIDRDDIDHLFKNEYGFTFRDRKRFWSAVQKFQSTKKRDDQIIYIEDDENPTIHNITHHDPSNYQLTHPYMPLALPNIHRSMDIYNYSDANVEENTLEVLSSEEDEVDSVQSATTSLPIRGQAIHNYRSKNTSDFKFKFPVELPRFSSKVIKAFETESIESEWQTFINEVAEWILNQKQTPMTKSEYQAIGHSVFKQYPSIGKDGFRPWSYFCRCLTQKIRKERKRR